MVAGVDRSTPVNGLSTPVNAKDEKREYWVNVRQNVKVKIEIE